MEVLLYCSKNPINIDIEDNGKDESQSNSCDIF